MISRRIVLVAAAVVSTALCAMPTQEELSKASYRCKCEWTGSEYIWSIWHGKWREVKRIQSKLPVAGGLKLVIGVNRGNDAPFSGTIDLNKCYIKVGDKLWWEGEKGAYKNANK